MSHGLHKFAIPASVYKIATPASVYKFATPVSVYKLPYRRFITCSATPAQITKLAIPALYLDLFVFGLSYPTLCYEVVASHLSDLGLLTGCGYWFDMIIGYWFWLLMVGHAD